MSRRTDVTQVSINLAGAGGSGDGQPNTVTTNGTNGNDVVEVLGSGSSINVTGLPALLNVTGSEG